MVDDSVNIAEQFPVPARGVPIICGVNFETLRPIPIIYFGRETKSNGREIPESPEPIVQRDTSSQRSTSNPLNSIIRKWEAQFAMQGGGMESGEYVSSNGRGDDRYYHADEWLDDGDEDEGDSGEYIGEVDLDAFRVITGNEDDDDEEDLAESDGTDAEDDIMDDAGGNWQVLIKRLDSSKQQAVKELVVDLETFQTFPGHTKQKKQKALRDSTARLRRLLPKVTQVQSQWQAAVWAVVIATNESANMQAFLELWNELAPNKQKEEITKDRDEVLAKISEAIKELAAGWKRGESIVRVKHDLAFTNMARIWDLWVQEEECAGRITQKLAPGKQISKLEKRFAASLAEILPGLPADTIPHLLRIALFGSKRTKKGTQAPTESGALPQGSDDEVEATVTAIPFVTLPVNIFIYKKNELLKCRLVDVKSLTTQTIQIIDKDWEAGPAPGTAAESAAPPTPEFTSLADVYESYQQKYVRKQDRVKLLSQFDAWKCFAVKIDNEYVYLFDLLQRAASVSHYALMDKAGNPIFLPSVAAARIADADKRKRIQEMKDERKRKRDTLEAKAKEKEMMIPPFNDVFIPFPPFDKELFKIDHVDGAPSGRAPELAVSPPEDDEGGVVVG